MRPLEDVQRDVLETVRLLEAVRVPVGDAFGMVLAADVTAPHDVPPFTNSAMDGYAVMVRDVQRVPATLKVIGEVAAGYVSKETLEPGTAIKIMTGAAIPTGADAVVRVEDTKQVGAAVDIECGVGAGDNIRLAGGDLPAGSLVFEAGTLLTAHHLGVLTSIGVSDPMVRRRPVVAVLSTGDEIVEAGAELEPGKIHDSNRPVLLALLDELGVQSVDLGIVRDEAEAVRSVLRRGCEEADVIISSGGVSMGEYDVVKAVLSETSDVHMWQVAIKPAKPFAFGTVEGRPFFGLPGNPVSVVVAFEQFARPALLKMMGARHLFRPRISGVLDVDVRPDPARTIFLRVVTEMVGGETIAHPAGGQSSNQLTALARANAFAVISASTAVLAAGSHVELEMFRWPESRSEQEVLGVR